MSYSIFLYRVFLKFFPVPVGEIPDGSRQEFYYFVYLLHWLVLFAPLTRATFIPAPFSRLIMIALGARVGPGSYSSGVVMDSQFVTVGSNSLIGLDVAILPHALEGAEGGALSDRDRQWGHHRCPGADHGGGRDRRRGRRRDEFRRYQAHADWPQRSLGWHSGALSEQARCRRSASPAVTAPESGIHEK